jgi:DNA helicase-2/ATP-dependent DNA helicase PcrA
MISEEQILADLTGPQREAVTHVEGPLLVLAGAGSGKTRVITRRIGYMISQGINPSSIVAITFTNKAAAEMAQRVRQFINMDGGFGPTVSTFHSFCVQLLRMYGKAIGLENNFTIFDTTDTGKLIKNACGDVGALPPGVTVGKVEEVISRAKSRMIGPDELGQRLNIPQYVVPALSRIYKRYEDMLRENKALDFDDLLLKTFNLLNEPFSRDAIHRRYQYLLVDEYQDTNHVQYLLAKGFSAHTRNFCATGDPDQSIYGWRGAEISNILDFEKDFPDAKIVYLENNYRSTSHILNAADSLIKNNKQRKDKKLISVQGAGEKLKIHSCEDENDEARQVVNLITQAKRKGRAYSQIAVMCRVNSLFRTLEQTLRDNAIPYQLARGVSFFQRKEIRDLMGYLRVVANPADTVSLERIINMPTRGIGAQAQAVLKDCARNQGISFYDAVLHAGQIPTLGKSQISVIRFAEIMERFRKTAAIPEVTMEQIVREVIDASGLRDHYRKLGEKDNRPDELSPVANLEEFIGTAQKYDLEAPGGSLTDFIAQLSLVNDVDAVDDDADRVVLLTMHAAKGLEFEQVIIVAVEEEILPHAMCLGTDSQIEEERRLFFVGITRAKRELHVCYAHHRSTRGSYRQNFPSRFLKEIDPQSVEGMDFSEITRPQRVSQFVISPRRSPEAEAVTTLPSRPKCQYRPGQRVYHQKFGYGVIQEVYLNGVHYNASIQFNTSGLKKLVLDIAPLQIVQS